MLRLRLWHSSLGMSICERRTEVTDTDQQNDKRLSTVQVSALLVPMGRIRFLGSIWQPASQALGTNRVGKLIQTAIDDYRTTQVAVT
jgi:hypothetical protein